MKAKGPIITLAAGLAVAAVLMVMNLSVTGKDTPGDAANTAATASPVPPSSAPAPTGVATQSAAAGTRVTYAGAVNGNSATLAIAVSDGKAVAYFCDGRSAEAWLQGTATGGQLTLTGANNATLTGTFGNGVAAGSVTVAGKQSTFSLKTVAPPSGLYRASANVRNAQLVGGWIVLDNGQQVGLTVYGGQTQPAPRLDTTSKTAVVDGVTVTVGAVDGSGL